MLSDDKLKTKLLLSYTICCLYKATGASTSMISKETGVPLSTVKRSLSEIRNKIDDYQRLLPELGEREKLLTFQKQLDLVSSQNKRDNKWSNRELSVETYKNQIETIKRIYASYQPQENSTIEDKIRMVDLRNDGTSYREIGKITGFSVSTVHTIVNGGKKK